MAISYSQILFMRTAVDCRDRLTNQAVVAPSSVTSRPQCKPINIQNIRPFLKRLCDAVVGGVIGNAPITRLFRSRSPSHVPFFIMPIVIDTVKRMFRRWFVTKFCIKFFKRFKMKFDTASAIFAIRSIGRGLASPFSMMEGTPLGTRCHSVGCVCYRVDVFSITPARRSFFCSQVRRSDSRSVAAITQTVPHCTLAITTRKANNQQPMKSLPRQNANSPFSLRFGVYGKIIGRHFVFSVTENNLASRVARTLNSLQPAFIIAQ